MFTEGKTYPIGTRLMVVIATDIIFSTPLSIIPYNTVQVVNGHSIPNGFLVISRLFSLDAKFNVIWRNSAHGCCTCSLKTYRLTVFNVERRLIYSYVRCQFCFKGRCCFEILIINCMCYFQYYTCVKHR